MNVSPLIPADALARADALAWRRAALVNLLADIGRETGRNGLDACVAGAVLAAKMQVWGRTDG